MTRKAILTTAEEPDRAPAIAPANRVRPKPSASLILLHPDRQIPRTLVGKRSSGHVFMPDVYVFPGGRRDPRDHSLPFHRDLHPDVLGKLLVGAPRAMTAAGARALALAAIRELREETGLVFGSASDATNVPDLSCLRYIARAVTPTGPSRRFDNRFFATFADEATIDLSQMHESDELHDLRWIPLAGICELKMPEITLAVLEDLKILLESDPSLPFGSSVHMYSKGNDGFTRVRL